MQTVGGKIFSATISFEEIKDDHWKCIIGCVQGYKENTHEAIKKIQKLMHGMRPSALLVFVIQELCQILNVNSIYGISDKCQIFRKKHGVYISPFHRISFDYDQFWKEVDGRKIDDQWLNYPKKLFIKNMPIFKAISEPCTANVIKCLMKYQNRFQVIVFLTNLILIKKFMRAKTVCPTLV